MRIRSYPVIFLIAVILHACGSSGDKASVRLEEVVSGTTSKTIAGAPWKGVNAGTTFVDGDALRTSEDGVARLSIGAEILRVGNDTTVYFGKKIKFDGELEIGAGAVDIGLDFGDATITSSGRIRIIRRDKTMRFVVVSGGATIERGQQIDSLTSGQELELHIKEGRLETLEPVHIDAEILDASVPQVDSGVGVVPSIRVTSRGRRSRIRGVDGGSWATLKQGEQELVGKNEVEVKRRSTLVFTRGTEKVTLHGPARAIIDPSSDNFIHIKNGRAEAHAKDREVIIAVPGGSIKLFSGPVPTRTSIEVNSRGTKADVRSGKISIRSGDSEETVRLGESARLQRGRIEVLDRAPSTSQITLPPQGNSHLHVITTPTNVRINFQMHCKRAVVEIAQGRSFRRTSQRREGEGSAIVTLKKGKNKYQVRCYQDGVLQRTPVATGSLTIRKDSGSRPLPKRAPANRIDTDGRNYTVVFQNRLPAITIRWKDAPTANKYQLKVVPRKGKTLSTTTSKPKYSFRAGQLREDVYEYWFSSSGRESKHSHLTISFDNAASTGYLSSPPANRKLDSDTAQVKGAAVLGWSVFVGAKRLTLDKQHRFDERVPVGSEGLAVRFSHPKYGNHYYLRNRQ